MLILVGLALVTGVWDAFLIWLQATVGPGLGAAYERPAARRSGAALTSMRTALILLLLLAVAAVPGSVLPQRSVSTEDVNALPARRTRARAAGWTGCGSSTSTPRPGSRRSTCCCSSRWSAAWCPGCASTLRNLIASRPTAPARLDRLPHTAHRARSTPTRRPRPPRAAGRPCAAAAGAPWSREQPDGSVTVCGREGLPQGDRQPGLPLRAAGAAGRGRARLLVRLARQPAAWSPGDDGFCNTLQQYDEYGARRRAPPRRTCRRSA